MAGIKSRVGIDIGSTAVRVAHVTGIGLDSLAHVTKAAVYPLQSGAVSAGKVLDINQVGFAIAQCLSACGAPRYGAIVGLSGIDVALSRLTVPQGLKPTEWLTSLRLAGATVSPRLNPNSSALSVYPLGDLTNGKTLLAAAGAGNDQVSAVAAACRAARVTPQAIDVSAVATTRALSRATGDPLEVLTTVDIGATTTNVVTRQGLHVRSLRVLDVGSESITLAIMGATQATFTEAERRKHGSSLTGFQAATPTSTPTGYGTVADDAVSALLGEEDAAHLAVRSAAATLVDQIAQAVESDADRYPDNSTQGVVVTGGGALLPGLTQAVGDRLGVGAALGRPWAQLTPGKGTRQLLDTTDPELALYSLTTAIGLGLWS